MNNFDYLIDCVEVMTLSTDVVLFVLCLCSDAVKNASSPLLVEIDRPFCCSLGIDFVSVSLPDGNAIVISNVTAASIADR